MRKAIYIVVALLAAFMLGGAMGHSLTGEADATAAPMEPLIVAEVKADAPVDLMKAEMPVEMPVVILHEPEAAVDATQEETPEPEIPDLASAYDIELIARTIWGEAEIVKSRAEQAAVAWCVLNRVDLYEKPIEEIVLAPYQFAPRLRGDVPDYFIELAEDVVYRWECEKAGIEDVGRTLPAEYTFFVGDGLRNHFSIVWKSTIYWDWSLPDPYTQEE